MCSISKNTIAETQLTELERSNDRRMIEGRLFQFASEADTQHPGALDTLKCHMRRLPQDLRHIRKKQIGRHRIFFTGYHTRCAYQVYYIKMFKRSGVNDEDDQRFQNKLRQALGQPIISQINPPDGSEEPSSN